MRGRICLPVSFIFFSLSRILKVYIEAWTGFSHTYMVSTILYSLKAMTLKQLWIVEFTFHGQERDEEPQIAQVKLEGWLTSSHISMTSSNRAPFWLYLDGKHLEGCLLLLHNLALLTTTILVPHWTVSSSKTRVAYVSLYLQCLAHGIHPINVYWINT